MKKQCEKVLRKNGTQKKVKDWNAKGGKRCEKVVREITKAA
jgi:hypothetical protein